MKLGFISFAHQHAYGYAESVIALPDVEITGIYDDDPKRGDFVAKKYNSKFFSDLDDLLSSDIDAVIICSENINHKEHVLKAASRGKSILCEKPIATNLEDAEQMVEACTKNGVILEIAFPVRFSQAIIQAKKILDSGNLGVLQSIRTTNRGQNPMGWFINKKFSGGGSVIDHTVHMVDIIRWFTKKEVDTVYAEIDTFFKDTPVEDAGIIQMTLSDGTIVTHDCSWSRCDSFPVWGDVTIELFGSKGNLKADMMKNHIKCFQDEEKAATEIFLGNNMDFDLIENFVEIVKGNRSPFITGMDGLRALAVSLAAYESSRTNKITNVENNVLGG
jgi:predicted dehydrogenase